MTTSPLIYLIDISSYIYRAFHAIRSLSNSRGMPTNAVFGVTSMLLKVLRERQPQYLALVFDAKPPTFRHHLYPQYKAQRPPMPDDLVQQLPYIQRLIQALAVPALEMSGYEADDIICTLTEKAHAAGFQVEIVSGDKDLLPLVRDGVSMWDPMKDVRYTPVEVQARYGLPPEQLVDMRSLAGDSSDNIPGVPGIGEKTAQGLIQSFHSLDNLLEHIDAVPAKKVRERLQQYQDQARLSRDLTVLRADVPVTVDLGKLRPGPPDRAALRELFQELQFSKFAQELGTDAVPTTVRLILTPPDLADVAARVRQAKRVALFSLSVDRHPSLAPPVGLALAWQEGEAVYIPWGAEGLPLSDILAVLGDIWGDAELAKISPDLKREWLVAQAQGRHLQGLAGDVQLASYLLNPAQYEQTIENISLDHLGINLLTSRQLAGRPVPAHELPQELAATYAGSRAAAALALWFRLEAALHQEDLSDLYSSLELPLLPLLGAMEAWGIGVDAPYLEKFGLELDRELARLEQDIHALAGEPFLINSPQQLAFILFEKLGLPYQKKTKGKTAYSTDVEVLTTLAPVHPIAQQVIHYRTLGKIKATYIEPLLKAMDPVTGRVHTTFVQSAAATGRLASRDPNLQNIPVRGEVGGQVRQAFIPEEGYIFVSGDYSQIELRLLAHFSDDPLLLQAFQEGRDIHRQTAAEVFVLHPELVTPEMRRQAKAINFGIIYGMSAFGLAKQLGVPQRLAQDFINRYFDRHAGVKAYFDVLLEQAHRQGWVTTLEGRRRYLPQINSSNRNIRQEAERSARNTPLQGTAADLIKKAMLAAVAAFADHRIPGRMLLQLHDELLWEVPATLADSAACTLREAMENVEKLNVPLLVDIQLGSTWGDMHSWPGEKIFSPGSV